MVESIKKTIELCQKQPHFDAAIIDKILLEEKDDTMQYYRLNEYFCYLVDLEIPDDFKDNELFLNKMHERSEKQ